MSTIFAERPRFFEGQYLGADDLESFLKYAREHDARHLLGAHTWGIVAGIELASSTSPAGAVEYFLTPGIAVDGYGRLIVVTAPYKLTTDLFVQQPSGTVDVWIRYDESPFSGQRAGFQVCDCSDAFARVAESFVVEAGPRNTVDVRESGIIVGDDTFTDAREALGFPLAVQPLACDGSVAAQTFPGEEDRDLWLIPVGQVPWDKTAGELLAASEPEQTGSRIFRRQAGLVTEHIYPAGGVIRLRPRWSARQPGVSTDQICEEGDIKEADLVFCGGELTFREMIWMEAPTRFKGDARIYGARLEFLEAAGTDYLNSGVPLAIRRRPDPNELNGCDLQVLLGERLDGPTRLAIGKATVQGDPCAIDFAFVEPGVYIQEDAKVGIGTPDSLLTLPLTIRAVVPTGDLIGFEAADGTLAWQINLGENVNGLNITETDPTETRLFLETGGNVGIGTLDPEAKLDIRNVPAPKNNTLGANKWFQIGDGEGKGRVWIQYGPSDQRAPLMVLSDLNDPPRIQFQQIGDSTETGPQFESWIGHAAPKSADLAVFNARLGVGTVNPFVNLTVQGSLGFKTGGDPMIYIHETGTANAERMVLAHSPGLPTSGLSFRDSDDSFLFQDAAGTTLAVGLSGNRNVGIGTTAPAERLDVRGDIKLGANGDFFGVGCLDNLRMVAGRVSDTGDNLSGTGYSLPLHTDPGQYRVNYAIPFSGTPVVVVTLVDAVAEDNTVTIRDSSDLGFNVHVRDVTNETEQNTAFNFIALGPRA